MLDIDKKVPENVESEMVSDLDNEQSGDVDNMISSDNIGSQWVEAPQLAADSQHIQKMQGHNKTAYLCPSAFQTLLWSP